MKVLAIETSCDETSISILEFDAKKRCRILANFVYSQIAVHQPFGGVVPTLAKREHQKNLVPILKLALKKADLLKKKRSAISPQKLSILKEILVRDEILQQQALDFFTQYQKPSIQLIAVTIGPGLAPALWPGVNFARALSFYWQIPIVGVNHLEGHILANWLPKEEKVWQKINISSKIFPALSLIVSGGHTQLVLIKKLGHYKVVGETRDDAAGECFDKTARLLNLGYPGGPAIAKEATKFQNKNLLPIQLPRPMINSKDYDFSFAGLKTAVLYLIEDLKKRGVNFKNLKPFIAKEIQDSINEVLVKKTIQAAKNFKTHSIILGGGVAANENLKVLLANEVKKQLPNIQLFIPETKYTGDNAAMIALVGGLRKKSANLRNWKNLEANANLRL
jgi:N6-L-threonylcarbamoyladenine synthase